MFEIDRSIPIQEPVSHQMNEIVAKTDWKQENKLAAIVLFLRKNIEQMRPNNIEPKLKDNQIYL